MARTISTRLAIEGEAQYKQAVASCNFELATLKSSLALVESEFRGNANSMEALTAKGTALESMYQKQLEKVVTLETALLNAKQAQEEYSSRVSTAQDNIQRCEQALEKLRQSTGDTSKEQEELTRELDKWNTELADAQAGQTAAERGIQNWQKQLNNAKIELNGLSDRIEQNNQYLREAETSADGCAQSIDRYGKEVKEAGESSEQFAQGAEQSRQGIEQLASALAAAGIAKAVKEISDALTKCVDTFASFESQMSTVRAISGATEEQLAALGEKAKYMGATTSFTATEAAQALEYMAMAGWKTEDMLGGLEGVMHLAAASGESLASVSDIVTDALTAFGLTAADSGRFADVLAAASSSANTNVGMMGETFKYAAPVAGALGYSIEDTALAVGLMANAFIKGGQAGTALRGVLTNLAKPSDTVASYMEKLGISLTDSSGQMRSLSELIDILRDRFSGLTEAQKAEYAAGIAGKEGMSGLMAIVNASEADYQKLTTAISICSGSAREMSEIRLDNFAGQMTLLSSAADGVKLAIGEQLTPALTEMAEAGTDVLTWATDFINENPWIVGAVVGVTASFAALTTGVTLYSHASELATAKTAILNAVMNTNPAVFVASALIGLVTAIGIYAASLDDADKSTRDFTDSLKETKAAYEDLSSTMEDQQASTATTAAALKDLLAVEEKSTAQKDSILRLVEDLNEAVPDLGLAYDAAADSINMTAEAMDAMLERAAGQETYNAQVDRLSQLYAEQTEIAARLKEAEDALTSAQGEQLEQLPGYFDIATDYNNALAESSAATGALENNVRELTAAQEANAAEIAELEAAANAYAEQQAEAAQKTGAMTSTMEGLIAEMESLQAAYDESYEAAMKSLESQMGLFQEMDGKAKTSIDSLIKTLTGQVEYMETYSANIQKAMEMGVDEGLVRKLSDGSEKSAQILAAIVKGGEDDITALNEQFAKVEEGKTAFSETVAEMETDFSDQMTAIVQDLGDAIQSMDLEDDTYTIGANNIQGLINGTVSKKRDLINEYIQMGYDALAAYKRAVGQHSPSKEFEKAGRFDMEGLAIGMKNSSGKVMETVEDVANEALSRLNDFLGDMNHAIFLAEKGGAATSADIIDAYRAMQQKIHETAEWYRAQGYSETSDEIQKLQKLWWDYADNIAAAQKKANKSVTDDFSDFIGDMEHEMFLAQKHGTDSLEYIVSAYREMQEKIHEMAEYYRNLGYAETSDEIQKYQKMWWGCEDEIAAAQEAAGKSAIDAFDKAVSEAKSRLNVRDLEYQLWERTDGKLASAMEKYEKQVEVLNEKFAEQGAVVEAAEARYQEIVKQYGENAEASYKYQEELYREELALQDIRDEIEKITAAKQELARQNALKQIEYNWMTSGLGIASAAAERTGDYDPYKFAQTAGIGVVTPGSFDEAVETMHYNHARHLSFSREEPRTGETLMRQIEGITAGTINAIASLGQSGSSAPISVKVVMPDGKVLAEAVADPLVDRMNANGTPIIKRK